METAGFLCHVKSILRTGHIRVSNINTLIIFNISLCLFFLQVVNRIREVPHRTRLLVVDRDTDDFLRSRGMACTENLAVEMGTLSPRPSPLHTPSISPIPRGISPLSLKVNHAHSFSADSPTNTQEEEEEVKEPSETSSATSETEVRGGVRGHIGKKKRAK